LRSFAVFAAQDDTRVFAAQDDTRVFAAQDDTRVFAAQDDTASASRWRGVHRWSADCDRLNPLNCLQEASDAEE